MGYHDYPDGRQLGCIAIVIVLIGAYYLLSTVKWGAFIVVPVFWGFIIWAVFSKKDDKDKKG